MGAVQMAEGVWWVGAVDWEIREFHGLGTPEGSTYNSYLVVDDRIALIDAVRITNADTLMRHVSEIVDPARIDYVISNHAEPDHTGSLPQVMEAAGNAKLLASKDGVRRLGDMYHRDWPFQVVGDGDEISLGSVRLRFFNAPLLHWPETMFSWCPERNILFSCDAFGAHMGSSERFTDKIGTPYVLAYTKKYFAYLIAAYRSAVIKAMKKIDGIDVRMVAPSHGPIWREGLDQLFDSYSRWAALELEDKATVVYGSMWGGTRKMAEAVADGLQEGGLEARAFNVQLTDPSDIIAETFISKLVLIGAPTFESGIYPPVEAFIPYMRIPRDKSKKVGVFGSFGWSGGAERKLREILAREGYTVFDESLALRFFPGEDGAGQCRAFGVNAAQWAQQEQKQPQKAAE